jgi:outer membrane protein TolC
VRRSILVLVSSALGVAFPRVPAPAQQRTVTLSEALDLAQRNAPRVVQASGNAGAAGWGVRAAWGEYLPRLTGSSNYGTSFSAGPSRTDPITGEVLSGNVSSSSLALGAGASLDLFTGFRRGADLRAARAGVRYADASLAFEKSQSALNTTSQFLLALQGADLVRVRQDAIRRAEEKLAIANAKLATRAATIADSLQAVVDLARARTQLLTEQRNLVEAEAGLARLVGLDGRVSAASDSVLFRTVAIADTAALLAEAMDRSPAVVQAESQAQSASASLAMVRASYFPGLVLAGNTSFNGSSGNDYQLFNNRSLSLSLQWQLFNGFGRERDVSQRRASLDFAVATAADARRDVGARLTTQVAALKSAEQRMALTAQSLEAARANVRVQTERYRLGSIGIVELNAAQDALSAAETDAVNARFDYLRARAQIEALLGRSL